MFLFLQPAPFPETLIANSLEYFLRSSFRGLITNIISEDAYSEYLRCMKDPATLHAMIEDYRAAASIDLEHDEIDLDKKIECPLLVLWDRKGAMEPLYDVLATWRERAIDVRGRAFPGDETARRAQADTGVFPGGHWMPEEFPNELYDEVLRFFS